MDFCSSLGKCWSFLWDGSSSSDHAETIGCLRICDLPDVLLERILDLVSTKDAVATSILSKRWRYVWTMLPKLEFVFKGEGEGGCFIDNALQLHKSPRLVYLGVELGPRCCVNHDVDVGKWVEKAVNPGLKGLMFDFLWKAEPTSLPMSLYTCNTLDSLTLSNKILLDVSSTASLPSLTSLCLSKVVYKDHDSLASLLSSSPILENLIVERHQGDNLTVFAVRVSSLKSFNYEEEEEEEEDIGLLVLDCPALTQLDLINVRDYCLVDQDMPCLDGAYIDVESQTDEKFMRSLSFTRQMCLYLTESMAACCNTIKFSRLIELYFYTKIPVDWLEPLMCLLQNSPKLKTLVIATVEAELPSLWNMPSTIPECLSSHLELVRWNDYGGKEDEKQLVRYILSNSKCLKTLEISFRAKCNLEDCQKELESMSSISASSPLLYFPTKPNWNIFS